MQNNRLAHMAVMVKQAFVLIVVLISLDLRPDDGGLVVFAFLSLPADSYQQRFRV
jgi:hypothetical protein